MPKNNKMDYEKINKAMIEVLEEKYNVKLKSKVIRKEDCNGKKR